MSRAAIGGSGNSLHAIRNTRYVLRFTFLIIAFHLLIFLFPPVSFAQPNFQWRNFTRISDGLSSNNVRAITDDRFGQIWLATSRGLSRFDGFWHGMDVSTDNPEGNDVFQVFEDFDGFIWAATTAGIYQGVQNNGRMDWLRHHTVETGLIDNRILTAIQRRNGEIWIGTPAGVNWFDGETWHPVANAEEGRLNGGVQVIYEDEAGNLWFGLSLRSRPNLLSRFDGAQWEVFGFRDSLPSGVVGAITEDSLGNLWIGTTAGAAFYDGSTWQVRTAPDFLIGNNVQSIMSDSEGTIWIGTASGISLFNRGRWIHLTKANGLASNNIGALFESRDGGIWAGTRDNGVSFSDRSWRSITTNDGLVDNRVTVMLTDLHGATWVGTLDGLIRYTMSGIELIGGLPGSDIRALAEDAQGRLWVGMDSGIAVFNPPAGQVENFPSLWRVFRQEDGLNHNSIQSIVVDSTGNVWAGTGILLSGQTGFVPGLDRYDGVQWQTETDVFREINRIVLVTFADTRGHLYFGTAGTSVSGSDLWVYDGARLNRINVRVNGSINTITEAPDRNIWVGTDEGIQILDGETLQPIARLTTDDGLVDNRVQALYRDRRNRVWIGTADGVSLFQNNRFERTLTASDGLNSNNIAAITESVDGTLWFGGKDGAGISRFDQEMAPPTTRIIEGPTDSEIVGDPSVFFKFEGGDASTPARELRYRYRLNAGPPTLTEDDGFADRVLLSNLAEGRHRFIVQAIDIEGNIDPVGAQAAFVVDSLPPTVSIISPKRGDVIGAEYAIEGTATDETDFLNYQIQISGQPVFTSRQPVDGSVLFNWDTRTAPDSTYTIQLVARDTANGDFDRGHRAERTITIVVDNTPPHAEIERPSPNAAISGAIDVEIELIDAYLSYYVLEYAAGPPGSPDVDDRSNLGWVKITDAPLPSGDLMHQTVTVRWDTSKLYGDTFLRARVSDAAGNSGESKIIPLDLRNDSAKPVVEVLEPIEGQLIAGEVSIIGTVDVGAAEDTIIEEFHLEYRPVDGASEWQPIESGQARFIEKEIGSWNTEELKLPDGNYGLRLSAIDNHQYTSRIERRVILDNTSPETIIESPTMGAVLGTGSIDVVGTVADPHFKEYQLGFRFVDGDGEPQPIPVPTPTQAKQNMTLTSWVSPQIGGEYEIRLTVQDRAGNENADSVRVVIDASLPEVQISHPSNEQLVSEAIQIVGTASDTNFNAYQLEFRSVDGGGWQPIARSTQPKQEGVLGKWEPPEVDGEYEIRLTARDQLEQTSEVSVRVIVDRLLPQAEILSPTENQQLPQSIEIRGTADDRNFKEYIIEYRVGESPDVWQPLSKTGFLKPVNRSFLAEWSVPNLSGEYTLRLRVEDKADHQSVDLVRVFFSGRVESQDGGTAQSEDGRAKIVFPSNSLPNPTVVTINPVSEESANGSPLPPFRRGDTGELASADSVSRFEVIYDFAPERLRLHHLKPATIEFSIQGYIPASLNRTLTIARWNGETWSTIGGTIDRQGATISTAISALGRYAVTTMPSVEADGDITISDLTCQPRVFSPRDESTAISFRLNQPNEVTIKIYNEAGRVRRVLKESEHLSAGRHVFWWDGRDDENQQVVSNFYIVTVEAEGALGKKVVVVQNN